MIAELIVNEVTALISTVGYGGVFLLMALESTTIPLPSELVMPFVGFLVAESRFDPWIALAIATLGSLVGSLFSYGIGYYGGHRFVKKFGKYLMVDEGHLHQSERWFNKRGGTTIFFARFIPGVRHLISIPAGIGKMNLLRFSVFTTIGAGIWNAILLGLGYLLGKNWQAVYEYMKYVDILVIIVAVAAAAYFIIHILRSRKPQKHNRKRQK